MNARLRPEGLPASPPTLAADDHGALFGAGFFETFRTRDGEPVRLAEHLARLRAACDRIGIRIPEASLAAGPAPERWSPALRALSAESGMTDGVFRLTVTAGAPTGGDYAAPREFLTVRPPPPGPPAEGISIHLLDTRRTPGEWTPRPKSLNYLNSLLASRELAPRRKHPADEGLMLDAGGRMAEGVFANLVWIRDGVVHTPHEDTGRLPGIGLAHLTNRLRGAGVEIREDFATTEDLLSADAVAMVSCVRGVVPVKALFSSDDKIIREWSAEGVLLLKRAFDRA